MGKPRDQNTVFFEGEGDAYYERNYNIDETDIDWPLKMIAEPPKRVLDVGCSRAWRLAAIQKRYGSECVGIDPSEEAVCRESKEHPDMTFVRCFAHDIPLQDQFDLVIANFVFTWIARETLLQSIAEIDRLTSKYLIIGDFYPPKPMKKQYHYIEEGDVFSYKQDYAQIFLSSGLYTIVKEKIYDYDEYDKGKCTLLKKQEAYGIDDRDVEFEIGRRRQEATD
jgi:SAM-dependent methyltransferase